MSHSRRPLALGLLLCVVACGGGSPTTPSSASSATQTYTASDFEARVLRASGAVMVEFYSSRCPHCQAMEPIVDSLAQRFVGQAHVGKVNVDQETTLAATYRIDLIPTFVVFKDGREVSRLVGETTEETLAALLRAALVG